MLTESHAPAAAASGTCTFSRTHQERHSVCLVVEEQEAKGNADSWREYLISCNGQYADRDPCTSSRRIRNLHSQCSWS